MEIYFLPFSVPHHWFAVDHRRETWVLRTAWCCEWPSYFCSKFFIAGSLSFLDGRCYIQGRTGPNFAPEPVYVGCSEILAPAEVLSQTHIEFWPNFGRFLIAGLIFGRFGWRNADGFRPCSDDTSQFPARHMYRTLPWSLGRLAPSPSLPPARPYPY
jgi:hypothetical protein